MQVRMWMRIYRIVRSGVASGTLASLVQTGIATTVLPYGVVCGLPFVPLPLTGESVVLLRASRVLVGECPAPLIRPAHWYGMRAWRGINSDKPALCGQTVCVVG